MQAADGAGSAVMRDDDAQPVASASSSSNEEQGEVKQDSAQKPRLPVKVRGTSERGVGYETL